MFAIPAPPTSFPHHPTFAAAAGTDDAHAEALIVGKVLGAHWVGYGRGNCHV